MRFPYSKAAFPHRLLAAAFLILWLLHHLPYPFAPSSGSFFVDDDEMAGVSDELFALHICGLDRRGAFVVEAAGEVTAGAVPAARAAQHAVEAVEEPAANGKADEEG